jgi:hypothetical protein
MGSWILAYGGMTAMRVGMTIQELVMPAQAEIHVGARAPTSFLDDVPDDLRVDSEIFGMRMSRTPALRPHSTCGARGGSRPFRRWKARLSGTAILLPVRKTGTRIL